MNVQRSPNRHFFVLYCTKVQLHYQFRLLKILPTYRRQKKYTCYVVLVNLSLSSLTPTHSHKTPTSHQNIRLFVEHVKCYLLFNNLIGYIVPGSSDVEMGIPLSESRPPSRPGLNPVEAQSRQKIIVLPLVQLYYMLLGKSRWKINSAPSFLVPQVCLFCLLVNPALPHICTSR